MKSIIKAKQRADRIWTPLIFRSSYQPSQLSTTRYSASAWRAILVNWWSWEPLLPVFAASSSKVCVSKPNCEHGGRKTALKINLPVPIASKSPPEPLSLFFFSPLPFLLEWKRSEEESLPPVCLWIEQSQLGCLASHSCGGTNAVYVPLQVSVQTSSLLPPGLIVLGRVECGDLGINGTHSWRVT